MYVYACLFVCINQNKLKETVLYLPSEFAFAISKGYDNKRIVKMVTTWKGVLVSIKQPFWVWNLLAQREKEREREREVDDASIFA
jgi:hypothetical protein